MKCEQHPRDDRVVQGAGKFTPGPWEQVPQNGAGPIIAHRYDTGLQMKPTGLRLICHMLERNSSLDQDKANARLIAAAPDLLAALLAAQEELRLIKMKDTAVCYNPMLGAQMALALEKAGSR